MFIGEEKWEAFEKHLDSSNKKIDYRSFSHNIRPYYSSIFPPSPAVNSDTEFEVSMSSVESYYEA